MDRHLSIPPLHPGALLQEDVLPALERVDFNAAQFTSTRISLALRFKIASCLSHFHQVVYETRRDAKMARRRAMTVALVNKIGNALAQRNRTWSAHLLSPYLPADREAQNTGSRNPESGLDQHALVMPP